MSDLQKLLALIGKHSIIKMLPAVKKTNIIKSRHTRYADEVEIFTFPKIESLSGLWSADALNEMLSALIPDGVTPAESQEFRLVYGDMLEAVTSVIRHWWGAGQKRPPDMMSLGYLRFVEDVGRFEHLGRVVLTDEDLVKDSGFPKGIQEEPMTAVPLERLITVRMFPNCKIARRAKAGEWDDGRIPVGVFNEYKPKAK